MRGLLFLCGPGSLRCIAWLPGPTPAGEGQLRGVHRHFSTGEVVDVAIGHQPTAVVSQPPSTSGTTRSDKTARSYLASITFAAARIWVKSGLNNTPRCSDHTG